MEWSGGLNPKAVAGRLSVTRLTHKSCTGIKASGMPRSTVKKILTTSPILEETGEHKISTRQIQIEEINALRYRMNCLVLL
jgi:hypothetical protein